MWKKIPGWENYEINELGSVRNSTTGNFLAGDTNNAGYQRIQFYKDGIYKKFFRHRLVAELFIENPNRFKEVNHIDGDKTNNSVSNLEWCNRTHNEREAHRLGIKKYKPFIAYWDDGAVKRYEFAIDLAEEIGVSKRSVLNYLQGKSKGYLSKGIKLVCYLEEKPND